MCPFGWILLEPLKNAFLELAGLNVIFIGSALTILFFDVLAMKSPVQLKIRANAEQKPVSILNSWRGRLAARRIRRGEPRFSLDHDGLAVGVKWVGTVGLGAPQDLHAGRPRRARLVHAAGGVQII